MAKSFAAHKSASQCAQHRKWQPGYEQTRENAAVNQIQRMPNQFAAQQELIQRPAQHEGEILMLLGGLGLFVHERALLARETGWMVKYGT